MTCPALIKCGACTLLDVPYQRQLELKHGEVCAAFESYGIKLKVHDTVGMDSPFYYRNKVIAYISMRGGKIACGTYEENSHSIVYSRSCSLQDKVLNSVLDGVRVCLDALKIKACGFGGVLKAVLLRRGVKTGQVMVVFVTSGDMFHGRNELVKRLVSKHSEITTIVQNVNPRDTSVVLGTREHVLFGTGYIFDDLLGYRFKLSPRSFYQINHLQTEKLYSKALELADIKEGDTLMDAYCGIGTIGICASGKAGCLIGVEVNGDAVDDARFNARAGGLRNASFHCSDVKAFMRDFDGTVDVLFVDPPRSGCDRSFLESVVRMAPRRIVYISCDPHTQARDVAFLRRRYAVSDAYPFDMFPHTCHIENIVVLKIKTLYHNK